MRSRIVAGFAAGVLLLVPACSSDDGEASTADTASLSTTEESADDPATDPGEDDQSETTAAAPASTSFSGAGSEAFCGMATELEDSDAADALFSATDPADVEAAWVPFHDLVNTVVATAPAEIKPDFETIAEVYDTLGEVLEANGWVIDDAFEAPAVVQITGTVEASGATERIDAYLSEVCGLSNS